MYQDTYAAAVAIGGTGGTTPVSGDVPFDALYISADGNLTLKFDNGQSVTLTAVKAGQIYPVCGRIVTACPANTVALYKRSC